MAINLAGSYLQAVLVGNHNKREGVSIDLIPFTERGTGGWFGAIEIDNQEGSFWQAHILLGNSPQRSISSSHLKKRLPCVALPWERRS